MDTIPNSPFGERIRQLRKERKMSQRGLADRVGIDFTYLSKIENNRADPPSDEVIRKMARELEVEEEELLAMAIKVSADELRKSAALDPEIGVLFRKLQSGNLTKDQLRQMIQISKGKKDADNQK
jgi:HTH-type transcriptional regulator, competence development regulator